MEGLLLYDSLTSSHKMTLLSRAAVTKRELSGDQATQRTRATWVSPLLSSWSTKTTHLNICWILCPSLYVYMYVCWGGGGWNTNHTQYSVRSKNKIHLRSLRWPLSKPFFTNCQILEAVLTVLLSVACHVHLKRTVKNKKASPKIWHGQSSWATYINHNSNMEGQKRAWTLSMTDIGLQYISCPGFITHIAWYIGC